jgi:hypothetical protein
VFHVKACPYFAAATNMFRLEDESVKAVRKNRFDNCPIRKKHYLRTGGIENNLYMPITIGCLVVFALRFNEGYRILIQTRSSKTATSNRVKSVSPTFGLSPFIGQPPERLGLLYYNFLREYLEELHYIREVRELDNEELSPRIANSYYAFIMEKAKMLVNCPDFNLYYIGFGFNLTNGNPNIGLLAKLDDTATSKVILDSIFCNWEVTGISDVSVHSGELGRLFSDGELDPASSFFLSKALRYLQ